MYGSDGPGNDSGGPGGGSGGPGGGSGGPSWGSETVFGTDVRNRQCSELQTARFRTLFELQTRDLVQNHRLNVLYLPIGVLDLENE